MADCDLMCGCLYFNTKMVQTPAMAELMKNRYCHGESSACARHMVYEKLGRRKIPPELSPYDVEKAKKIIASK